MLELATDWRIEVDRGPEWLFFRVVSAGLDEPKAALSRTLWATATESATNRIVVELADGVLLNSYLIGQLIVLHKRAHMEGGTVRLCALADHNLETLQMMRLGERFPNYASREAAVMGHYPNKPR